MEILEMGRMMKRKKRKKKEEEEQEEEGKGLGSTARNTEAVTGIKVLQAMPASRAVPEISA
ncbi:unnamed protein product [Clonostachys chloroleuca]|uniref:Uncharacterized protein n=1 Tax=Clonostachys chloroleuca TaxID=1926264 RepID=A0AA35Q5W2_9HYPO|nr:unnamed protein product [Clonostachys chloroleuca]